MARKTNYKKDKVLNNPKLKMIAVSFFVIFLIIVLFFLSNFGSDEKKMQAEAFQSSVLSLVPIFSVNCEEGEGGNISSSNLDGFVGMKIVKEGVCQEDGFWSDVVVEPQDPYSKIDCEATLGRSGVSFAGKDCLKK